jgi:hypothetical protein
MNSHQISMLSAYKSKLIQVYLYEYMNVVAEAAAALATRACRVVTADRPIFRSTSYE